MNYTCFTLVSVITTFPANYVIDTYGTRPSIMFATAVVLVGIWIRMFINQNYLFALGGQCIIAIGYTFIMNSTPAIGGKWFGATQRTMATTIGALMTPLAALI